MNIDGRLRKAEAAAETAARRGPRTVDDMSDAELIEVIRDKYPDFPDHPTREQLQAIIDAEQRL